MQDKVDKQKTQTNDPHKNPESYVIAMSSFKISVMLKMSFWEEALEILKTYNLSLKDRVFFLKSYIIKSYIIFAYL